MQKYEKTKTARSAALAVLLRCEKQGAWLDGALKSEIRASGLPPRDAALCSKICYGVCQNQLLLTFWLSHFSKVKPEKLEPAVRISILMAMYQIKLLDRIPQRAAVNEAVKLAGRAAKIPGPPPWSMAFCAPFADRRRRCPGRRSAASDTVTPSG